MRLLALLAIVSLATAGYAWLYGKALIGVDDANIYFVYARNAVDGYGFVFHPGGERVQGFTSEPWQLVCMLAYFLAPGHFEIVLLALTVLITSFALWVICAMLDRLAPAPGPALSAPVLCLLGMVLVSPGYVEWGVLSLMETGLWGLTLSATTAVIFFACLAPEKKGQGSVALAALLPAVALVRPEGPLFVGYFLVLHGVMGFLSDRDRTATVKRLLLPAVTGVSAVVGIVGWRLWYFGYPFPNTYYAKVSNDRLYELQQGLVYLAKCFVYSPLLFVSSLAAGVVVVSLLVQARRRPLPAADRGLLVLALTAGFVLAVPLYAGGDHFALARFYQPFLPLLLLPVFAGRFWSAHVLEVKLAPGWRRYTLAAVTVALASALPSFQLVHFPRVGLVRGITSPVQIEFDLATRGRRSAVQINQFFAGTPKPRCGVIAAGGFPYAYEGESIDLLGLNNLRMAHSSKAKVGKKGHASFDLDTFHSLHPDLLLCEVLAVGGPDQPQPAVADFVGQMKFLQGLDTDPRFWKDYAGVSIRWPQSGDRVTAMASLAFVQMLEERGFEVTRLPGGDARPVPADRTP